MREIKYDLDKISLFDLFKQFDNGDITFEGEICQDTDSWAFELLEEILHGHYHGVTIELVCDDIQGSITYNTKGVIQHDITPYALWQLFKKRENSKHQVCLNLNNSSISLSHPNIKEGMIPLYDFIGTIPFSQYDNPLQQNFRDSVYAFVKCLFPVVKILNS